jgi:predicted amidophosphoribosyltransferase
MIDIVIIPGFGACARCPLLGSATAPQCWCCARDRLSALERPRCGVCDQTFPDRRVEPTGPADPVPFPVDACRCPNFWCGRDDRGFDVVWAVAQHREPLRQVIARYKYRGDQFWAVVLGRVLAGYLLEHSPWFEEFELVTSCPGVPTPDRPWDHMRAILAEAAASAGPLWPFDVGAPAAVVKTSPTVPLASLGSPASRRLWAACELRQALAVPEPARVEGRQVLVVDDVFTDGSTLREVSLALRDAGAVGVSGLVLARRPWRAGPLCA